MQWWSQGAPVPWGAAWHRLQQRMALFRSCAFYRPLLCCRANCTLLCCRAFLARFQALCDFIRCRSLVLVISWYVLSKLFLPGWGLLQLCLGGAAVEHQQSEAEFPHCFPFLILREKPSEKSCQSRLWNLTCNLKIAFRWELRVSEMSWLEEQHLANPQHSAFPKLIFHIESPLPFPHAV